MLPVQELFKRGQARSACAPEQLQNLIDLVSEIRDVPGDIIEIGSYKGGSTIIFAAASEVYSPKKKIYAFDTFSGRPPVSSSDSDMIGPFDDTNLSDVQQAVCDIPSISLVKGLHEETVPNFTPRPISLLFLDSDLYESHRVALEHFWPDVSLNGVVVFHDFAALNCPGVRKAFDEFFKGNLQNIATNHSYLSGMLVVRKQK